MGVSKGLMILKPEGSEVLRWKFYFLAKGRSSFIRDRIEE